MAKRLSKKEIKQVSIARELKRLGEYVKERDKKRNSSICSNTWVKKALSNCTTKEIEEMRF